MLRPILPLCEYLANQDYIAEFLCVNKDKPALNCKGKCYLMQQLNDQKQDKKENLPKIDIQEYPIGFVSISSIMLIFTNTSLTSFIATIRNNHYDFLYSDYSFRPPNTLS